MAYSFPGVCHRIVPGAAPEVMPPGAFLQCWLARSKGQSNRKASPPAGYNDYTMNDMRREADGAHPQDDS
jgi:hypothetical protein